MALKILDWVLCMMTMWDLLAQPHSSPHHTNECDYCENLFFLTEKPYLFKNITDRVLKSRWPSVSSVIITVIIIVR
jgi:hypothetical protein